MVKAGVSAVFMDGCLRHHALKLPQQKECFSSIMVRIHVCLVMQTEAVETKAAEALNLS